MGAYVLAKPPPTSCLLSQDAAHPLMFQKEISSDGNINTVDVMYPAMPFFLYANPSLLKYNLEPLFQNQEGNFYPNQYSMHDLGSQYVDLPLPKPASCEKQRVYEPVYFSEHVMSAELSAPKNIPLNHC